MPFYTLHQRFHVFETDTGSAFTELIACNNCSSTLLLTIVASFTEGLTKEMPATDRTSQFREILKEVSNSLPEVKRRKVSKPSHIQRDVLGKQYLAEAYIIVRKSFSESHIELHSYTYYALCSSTTSTPSHECLPSFVNRI